MAELETGDKLFNRNVKQAAWFIGLIISVVLITVAIMRYVKSEVNDSIKTAIAEVIYEMKDFKSVKASVADHEKEISILQYRVNATESVLNIPTINKNIRVEELNGRDTRKKQKEVDDNS